MLWYKSWLDTRWRFLSALGLLMLSAGASVFAYPQVAKLLPLASSIDTGGEIGRRIKEAMVLQSDYRGYVWSQWFSQNLFNLWTLCAAALGTGGLVSQTSGGAALFTLSLPASRNDIVGVRAVMGLVELTALALLPSLLIPLFSPEVGQRYGIGDTLVFSLCLVVAGSAIYSLAFLLATVFDDVWRPALVAIAVAVAVGLCEQFVRGLAPYGIVGAMNAESYFRSGQLPWPGLAAGAALSAAMLYLSFVNVARRDF